MTAPATTPLRQGILTNLPKRSCCCAGLALPKASRIGLDERIAWVLARARACACVPCACASEVRLRCAACRGALSMAPRATQPPQAASALPSPRRFLPAGPKPASLSQACQPVPCLPACPKPSGLP